MGARSIGHPGHGSILATASSREALMSCHWQTPVWCCLALCSACSVPVEPVRQPSLVQDAYIKASNTGERNEFGHSIAISADGSTLAVGAPGESSADPMNQSSSDAFFSGAVYVFQREGLSWTQRAYLKAPAPQEGARFGASVALSADGAILAVGAPEETVGLYGFAGAVYVFERDMSLVHQLHASNPGGETNPDPEVGGPPNEPDRFGSAVALSADGSVLAVGAPWEDSDAKGINADQSNDRALDSGAVYVFVRGSAGWIQKAYVKPSNTGAYDEFGGAIALSGDGLSLAVGALLEDGDATGTPSNELSPDSGAVYVFGASPSWGQQAYVKASNTSEGDGFGRSVSLSRDGSVLAVGASSEDGSEAGVGGNAGDNQLRDSGAAYVFARSSGQPGMWQQQTYLKASNPGEGDHFGSSIALSSDNLGLVVGAPREDSNSSGVDSGQADNSYSDAGAAYVFENSGGSWRQLGYLKPSNPGRGEQFGDCVALPGDAARIAVSAWKEAGAARGVNGNEDDKSLEGAGAAYVFERN